MKNLNGKILNVCVMLIIISAPACKKSSSGADPGGQTSGTFKGTVGATAFSASGVSNVSGVYQKSDSTMDISATQGSDLMTLGITHYQIGNTGIFTMSHLQTGGFAHLGTTSYYSQYGTITVTASSSTLITGTFNYTCKDSTKVNGTFSSPVHSL